MKTTTYTHKHATRRLAGLVWSVYCIYVYMRRTAESRVTELLCENGWLREVDVERRCSTVAARRRPSQRRICSECAFGLYSSSAYIMYMRQHADSRKWSAPSGRKQNTHTHTCTRTRTHTHTFKPSSLAGRCRWHQCMHDFQPQVARWRFKWLECGLDCMPAMCAIIARAFIYMYIWVYRVIDLRHAHICSHSRSRALAYRAHMWTYTILVYDVFFK